MAHWRFCFCLTILILKISIIWTQLQCPEKCVCTSNKAECDDIESLSPFPDYVVNVTIQHSSLELVGPNAFGRNVQQVFITKTRIEEISSSAFNGLRSLQSVQFVGVFIGTIKSCAFSDITGSGVIRFSQSKINIIEPGAFSHITGITEINITLSTINHVDSFAFSNIQSKIISVSDAEILLLSTYAFESIRDIDLFKFYKVKMTTVKAGAFSNVTSFTKVLLDGCMFENIECNAVMELREATSMSRTAFVFTNSTLLCNCSTLDMLAYVSAFKSAVTDTVLCLLNSSSKTTIPLAKVSRSSICPQLQFRQTCSYETPSLPKCKVTQTGLKTTDGTGIQTVTGMQVDQEVTMKNKGSRQLTTVMFIVILVGTSLNFS